MIPRPAWRFFPALMGAVLLAAVAADLALGQRPDRMHAVLGAGALASFGFGWAFARHFRRSVSEPVERMTSAASRMSGDLQRTIDELRRLEKVRIDFVANVSHELRTPLTSIKGFVETLEDGALEDPATARKFLGIVRKHTDRLIVILNDLLVLSQLDSGEASLRPETFDLGEFLREELDGFAPRAAARRQTLSLEPGPQPAPIKADRERLSQVVANLVDNALKYTPEGGQVRATWSRAGAGWAFSVSDTGVGIPPGEQARVFERFYRVDKARSQAAGGTGLGLSIVKHIVQTHGGRIELESEPGKGSTFRVVLPA